MSSDQSFFCESLEPRRLLTTLGTLDPSFSRDAQAYAAFGDTASAASVAVQSDGKVLIAGSIQNTHGIHFAVARFNADGSPDKTFGGGDGLLTFNPLTQIVATDAGLSSATSIGVDSNGKILVAGFSSGVIAASTDPLGLRTFAKIGRAHV